MPLKELWWRIAVLVAAAALAGCASFGPRTAEEIVSDRAQQRWTALLAGQWDRAYALMAPSYRAVVAPNRFGSQFTGGVAWRSAEVVSASCEAERCTVRIKIVFHAPPMAAGETGTTHFNETWVLEDGQWWMYQKP